MILKKGERLICAGRMPLRAPGGNVIAAVPIYKIVPADDVSEDSAAVDIAPGEQLIHIGVMESKETAEERFNALITGGIATISSATPLYIKDTADSTGGEIGLTECEKRALNSLVAEITEIFSAAMEERETVKRQRKRAKQK